MSERQTELSAPLLPRDGVGARPLFAVVAIVVALACLASLGARAAFRAAETWSTELQTAMTVRILSPTTEGAAERAALALRTIDGVTSATAMDRKRAAELLRPWLGSGDLPEDLPLPALIEVGINPAVLDVEKAVAAKLAKQGFTADVDDHSRWAQDVQRASGVVRSLALVALGLLAGAGLATVAFAARASLETRRDVVEIAHMVGAEDKFVASAVQDRFVRLGLQAGAAGAGGALVTALLVWLALGSGDGADGTKALLGGASVIHWTDIWILLVAPVLAAAASGLTARLSALATLRRLF